MSFLQNLANRAQQLGHTIGHDAGAVANTASRVYDQVNPLDNGLSYQTRQVAPQQAQHSLVQQLVNTGYNVGKPVVQLPVQFAENYANTFANIGNRLGGGHNVGIQQNMGGTPLLNKSLQFSGATGQSKQLASDIAQIGLSAATPAIGKGIEAGVSRAIPSIAPAILRDVAPRAISSGQIMGGYNALSAAGQGGTTKDIAKAYGQGVAVGTALPIAAKGIGAGGQAVLNAADKAKFNTLEKTGQRYNGLKPQQIITNPDHLQALDQYQSSVYDKVPPPVKDQQRIQEALHQVKQTNGLDFLSGSAKDRADRIANYQQQWHEGIARYQNKLMQQQDNPSVLTDQNGGINNQSPSNADNLRQKLGQISDAMKAAPPKSALKNQLATQADQIAGQLNEADIAKYQARNAAEAMPPSKRSLVDTAAVKAKGMFTPLDQAGGGAVKDSPVRQALQGGKQRGLTTGMKQSPEFTPQLQDQIKSSYQPFTDKAATMTTGDFMKQPLADSYHQVLGTLAQGQGYHVPGASGNALVKFGKQEVSNAGAVMKALDQSGRHDEAQQVHDLLAQKLTNAGQTSQATKLIYNRTPEGLANMARRDLTNAGIKITPELKTQLDAAINNIKSTADGTKANDLARKQFDKLVGTHMPTGLNTKVVSLYKTGILSSPKTAVKVAMVQIPNAIGEHATDFVAAPIDKAVSAFTGKRKITAPGIETTKAVLHALPGAVADAKTRFKDDIVMPNSSGMAMSELSTNGPRAHGANFGIAKGGGRTKLDQLTGGASSKLLNGYTSSIGRVHGAFQTVPYELRRAESLAQSAVAEAKNQGLSGAERAKFIQDFQKNPPKQALETADQAAQYSTNQQKTALGQAASGLQHTLPGGQFIAPITRIPGAVATQVINYSPAGFVKTAAQAGLDHRAGNEFNQAAFSRGMARATIGTGLLAGGTALAAQGRVSGAYPKDRATQTLWQSANIPANSVYVGGKAYPGAPWKNTGGTWQQVSSPGGAPVQAALAGGAAYDGYKQGGVTQAALQGGQGAAQIVTNQPYLTGLSGAMGAINTPNQAKSFLDQSAGSVVPNFVRDFAQATDPLQRQTAVASPVTSMKNAVTNGIPGLREKNLPQVGVFGNTVPRNNGAVNALLNPLNPQTSNASPLTNAMGDIHNATDINGKPLPIPVQLDKKLTVTDANGKKTILPDAQRTQLIQQSGQAAQQAANQLINTNMFKNATPEQQSKLLADVVNGQRALSKQSFGNATKLSAAGKAAANGRLPQIGNNGKVTTGSSTDIANNLPDQYKSVLNDYNKLDDKGRQNKLNSQNDYEFKLAEAKYQNDKAAGKITSDVADMKRQQELGRLQIGSQFSKEARDAYSLTKPELTAYLNNHPDKADQLYSEIQAYDNAQYQAGARSSLKFKNGLATKTSGGSKKGSGGVKRASSVSKAKLPNFNNSAAISRTANLTKKVASSTVKGASSGKKVAFSTKIKTAKPYKLAKITKGKVA